MRLFYVKGHRREIYLPTMAIPERAASSQCHCEKERLLLRGSNLWYLEAVPLSFCYYEERSDVVISGTWERKSEIATAHKTSLAMTPVLSLRGAKRRGNLWYPATIRTRTGGRKREIATGLKNSPSQ